MLLQNVSLLTLGLVISLSLQAQIIILPDNSTTVDDTLSDSAHKVVNPRNKPKPEQSIDPVVEEPKPAPAPSRKKSSRDSFVLGFDLRQYKYEEPDFVTHQGLMYGATAQYLMVYQSGEVNLNTEMLYGKLTYDGSIERSNGTVEPISVTNTDFFSKSNALWQWAPAGPGSPFVMKFGLGLRYLSDNYTDAGFYQRTGLWVYLPVGIGFRSSLSSATQMTFDLTYQHIVYGGINSKLSETGIAGLDDIYLKQTGHGLELEVGAVFNKVYHASAYYEGWYMDESETVNTTVKGPLHEPANSAISYGVKLGYDLF